MDGELIKVNIDIHKGKIVNIVFDILHIVGSSLITLLRTIKILEMGHYPSARRRGIRLFKISPCNRVAETDLTIALKSNWSCMSQKIWSEFGEGDVASGRVIIAGGHDFESSTKPTKSYPNMRDGN